MEHNVGQDKSVIALVGLGLLGSAISHRLREGGAAVRGADVVEAARVAHDNAGGQSFGHAADAVEGCDVILLSLPNGGIARAACLGDGGVVEGAREGALIIDTTTSRPSEAESLGAALAERGLRFIDVGLSGSSHMVAAGDCIAVAGGATEDVAEARPVLEKLCREVFHTGPLSHGMRAKLVINQVLALNRVALAEALVLCEAMGTDPATMLSILKSSAASSKAMDMWGERMVTGEFGEPTSRVRQHIKDADHILELGREFHAPMPLMVQAGLLAQSAYATGLKDEDNAAVVEVLRRMAGLGRIPPRP